jgi:4-amino-4-deoxy-L-arabinose transferase-like glycosyltransferase
MRPIPSCGTWWKRGSLLQKAAAEVRTASQPDSLRIALFAVLAGASLLRFWGLHTGIPYALGVDEPQIMARSFGMMLSGDLNPHFFHYPGLYIYLQFVVSCVYFLYGALRGWWSSLDEVGMETFFLWGSMVTAFLGVMTVFLVYLAGKRWGTAQALLAAAFMAVMPSHVRESHYILTDVPTTFFVTLTLVLTFRAYERGTVGAFAWAGVAAGLAAATKYNGGVSLVMPLMAAWMSRNAPSRTQLALCSVYACAGAFLLGAPYTILDLPAFLNSFGELAVSLGSRSASAESGEQIYLKHLRINMGSVALLLTFIGLAIAMVRSLNRDERVRYSLVIVFPLLYFFMISGRSLIFARYLLPAVPFICLLASFGVMEIAALVQRFFPRPMLKPAVIVAVSLVALLPPARQSIGFNRMIVQVGTPRLAYEWIAANVPRGSDVVVELGAPLFPRGMFKVHQVRRAIDPPSRGAVECSKYLVASSMAYSVILDNPGTYAADYAEYQGLFDKRVERAAFKPSSKHPGPELKILEFPSATAAQPCR